jgi:hypothetical protein
VPDTAAVTFLQGMELAVVSLYAPAAALVGSPAAVHAVGAFVAHHRAHARALAELAGASALSAAPAKMVATLAPSDPITSERDALAFLHTLESRLAATQQFVLGAMATVPAIALLAATIPVECQHATVLGSLLSLPMGDVVPVAQGVTGHLDPEDYAPA